MPTPKPMPLDTLRVRLKVARERAADCVEHGYHLCAADYEKQAAELERLIEAKERECA